MNPYPGIRPFSEEEADLFFGRDEQVYEVLRRLSATRLLLIAGLSGCGKSSLIRAGVVPGFRGGLLSAQRSNWNAAVLHPGENPLGNLASALRKIVPSTTDDTLETTLRRSSLGLVEAVREMRLDTDLLIVVDQFEELFRLSGRSREQEDEAALFVRLLLEAVRNPESHVYVLIALRSEFLGDCFVFRDLPEAISNGLYLVPRMTRDQLRKAIENPAEVSGATMDPLLVQSLLNLDRGSDSLGLMQHALRRTWALSEQEGTLRIEHWHYASVGGPDALSLHADITLPASPEGELRIVQKLFVRLVDWLPGAQGAVRRPASIRELAAVTEVEESVVRRLLSPFVEQGLVSVFDDVYDLVHEALVRQWPRLQDWMRDEAKSAELYRHMVYLAGYSESLLAGQLLDAALTWGLEVDPNRAWAERYGGDLDSVMSLLDKSRQYRDELERQALRAASRP